MAGNMRALKRKLEPEKGEQDPGTDGAPSAWLQEKVSQLRKDSSGVECNQDRVRFLSEWQKVKQGTGGVMYWMFRDQRVQGNPDYPHYTVWETVRMRSPAGYVCTYTKH